MWLDFAGNFWKFPHPDEDPEWPSGEETTQELIKKKKVKVVGGRARVSQDGYREPRALEVIADGTV